MGGLFRVVKDLAAFRSWQRMNFLMHTSKHAKSSWRYCHQFFSPQDLEILICPMWVEIFKIAPIQTSIFCRRSDRTCMCSVSLVPFFFSLVQFSRPSFWFFAWSVSCSVAYVRLCDQLCRRSAPPPVRLAIGVHVGIGGITPHPAPDTIRVWEFPLF